MSNTYHIHSETKLKWCDEMVRDYRGILVQYEVRPTGEDVEILCEWIEAIVCGNWTYTKEEFVSEIILVHNDIRETE